MEITNLPEEQKISFVMMSHNLASLLIDWLEYSKKIRLTAWKNSLLIENENGSELELDVETSETDYKGQAELDRIAAKRVVGILMMMRTQQIRITIAENHRPILEFTI